MRKTARGRAGISEERTLFRIFSVRKPPISPVPAAVVIIGIVSAQPLEAIPVTREVPLLPYGAERMEIEWIQPCIPRPELRQCLRRVGERLFKPLPANGVVAFLRIGPAGEPSAIALFITVEDPVATKGTTPRTIELRLKILFAGDNHLIEILSEDARGDIPPSSFAECSVIAGPVWNSFTAGRPPAIKPVSFREGKNFRKEISAGSAAWIFSPIAAFRNLVRELAEGRALDRGIGMHLIALLAGIYFAVPAEIRALKLAVRRGATVAVHGVPVITLFSGIAIPVAAGHCPYFAMLRARRNALRLAIRIRHAGKFIIIRACFEFQIASAKITNLVIIRPKNVIGAIGITTHQSGTACCIGTGTACCFRIVTFLIICCPRPAICSLRIHHFVAAER